jgi:hypothetical protein
VINAQQEKKFPNLFGRQTERKPTKQNKKTAIYLGRATSSHTYMPHRNTPFDADMGKSFCQCPCHTYFYTGRAFYFSFSEILRNYGGKTQTQSHDRSDTVIYGQFCLHNFSDKHVPI